MEVHHLVGKAHLQRGAVRSSWANYLETSLRMSWCLFVKRYSIFKDIKPHLLVDHTRLINKFGLLKHLKLTFSSKKVQTLVLFLDKQNFIPFYSLAKFMKYGWWWISMGTTEVMLLSHSVQNKKLKMPWSNWIIMKSGKSWKCDWCLDGSAQLTISLTLLLMVFKTLLQERSTPGCVRECGQLPPVCGRHPKNQEERGDPGWDEEGDGRCGGGDRLPQCRWQEQE